MPTMDANARFASAVFDNGSTDRAAVALRELELGFADGHPAAQLVNREIAARTASAAAGFDGIAPNHAGSPGYRA